MPDPAPSPSPAPAPAPPAATPPLPPGASENARFAAAPDPFAGINVPEKFRKDGKPDLGALVTSYGELETRFNSKTDELRKQIADEMAAARPKAADAYTLPKIKDIDDKELAEHPMIGWWREQAFEAGLPQDKFAKAIETYIEKMQPQPVPDDVLKKELGDSFKARIAAVDAWATKTAKNDGEMEALKAIGTTPDGIRLMERLAGLGGGMAADSAATIEPGLTIADLRAMQNDPRYWNPAQRDAAFVAKVEEGYRKLYPDDRRSA
jgi:hypothetical protein